MQIIAEAYDLLRYGLGLPATAIGDVFAGWNAGALPSYLMALTADIVRAPDDLGGRGWLLDQVHDAAGRTGSGRMVPQAALELGNRGANDHRRRRCSPAGLAPGPPPTPGAQLRPSPTSATATTRGNAGPWRGGPGLEDLRLRTRISAPCRGGRRPRLRHRSGRSGPYLESRVHYPLGVPRRRPFRLRPRGWSCPSVARCGIRADDPQLSRRLAYDGTAGNSSGNRSSGNVGIPGILRHATTYAPANQRDPGSAGSLRCSRLSAPRSPWQILEQLVGGIDDATSTERERQAWLRSCWRETSAAPRPISRCTKSPARARCRPAARPRSQVDNTAVWTTWCARSYRRTGPRSPRRPSGLRVPWTGRR